MEQRRFELPKQDRSGGQVVINEELLDTRAEKEIYDQKRCSWEPDLLQHLPEHDDTADLVYNPTAGRTVAMMNNN